MIVVVWVVFSADARQKQTRGQAACAERDQVQQELQQWEATVLAVGRGWKILYIYIYTWLFLVRVSEDVQGPLILGVALQSALDTNCHQKADHP